MELEGGNGSVASNFQVGKAIPSTFELATVSRLFMCKYQDWEEGRKAMFSDY